MGVHMVYLPQHKVMVMMAVGLLAVGGCGCGAGPKAQSVFFSGRGWHFVGIVQS